MSFSSIPLSLYIHLPWCERKCPYCDFNSHPSIGGMDETAYVDALLRDLDFELRAFPEFIADREIGSIFIGGGTPSLFSPGAIARVLDGANRHLPFKEDVEITLEANPGSSEQTRFSGYRDAGVNRLSIGIQSFDAEKLLKLGRVHDPEEALNAAKAARQAGFDNFNLDLMYALPGQNLEMAGTDLKQAIDLGPSHISYYQLTLEPNTHFFLHPPALPDHDLAWDMHTQGEQLLASAGYRQYEISAYALEDHQCLHNLNYWSFGDYLGIGAGAHGKLSHGQRIIRNTRERIPQRYMENAGSDAAISEHREVLMQDRCFEFLLNSLRLKEGFRLPDFQQRTGLNTEMLLSGLRHALSRGLIEVINEQLTTTPLGWRHVDSILSDLLESTEQDRKKLEFSYSNL